jgi:hypothetical protein
MRVGLLTGTLMVAFMTASPARATVLYQTGFEPSEGYNTNLDLVGQRGWQGAGSGGNGIVSGFLPGTGHQAYVGFNPPLTNDSSVFIYQPINKRLPQVLFSVTFSILDSVSTTNRDEFYWSVFNRQGQPLFTLDFNNVDLGIYYHLDGPNDWAFTGVSFTNEVAYRLNIAMDFTSNRWSATLGATLLATNQPITTVQAGGLGRYRRRMDRRGPDCSRRQFYGI